MLLKLCVNASASKNCKIIDKGKHTEFVWGPPHLQWTGCFVLRKKKSPELVHPQEFLNQNFKLLQIKELQLRINFFSLLYPLN